MPVPGLSRNRDAADLTHGGRSLRGGRGQGHTRCGHHSSLCHRPGVPQPEGGREEGGEEGGEERGEERVKEKAVVRCVNAHTCKLGVGVATPPLK